MGACGGGGVCTATCTGASCSTIHKMMYSKTPVPPHNTTSSHNTRTSVTSMSKYSARPAHTPPSFLLMLDRISFFGPPVVDAMSGAPVTTCCAPQLWQNLEPSAIFRWQLLQIMTGLLQ